MSTLSACPGPTELSLSRLRLRDRSHALHLLGVFVVTSLAAGLRFWECNAVLATSDQVAMAYLVRHGYGVRWIFAHDYGPVLPALMVAWTHLLAWFDCPIGDAAIRFPIALIGVAQVPLTFALLGRMNCSRLTCWAGAVACAVLPSLVTDAHYPWGYQSVALFCGTVSLWALLAWLDERRGWQLAVSMAFLCLHCLSGVDTYAVPAIMGVLWWWALRPGEERARPVTWRQALVGYVTPLLLAAAVALFSLKWTGAGELGRWLHKADKGTFGLHFEQFLQLPVLWCRQFGPVFGLITVVALFIVGDGLFKRRREALLAVWAGLIIVPYTLLADWGRIGWPQHYLTQACFAAALLGTIWLAGLYRARIFPRWLIAMVAAIALAQMGIGDIAISQPSAVLATISGTRTGWGNVAADTGIKAAGYYVREYVPASCRVMSLHAQDGMELTVAEYYCGRRMLASYDLPEEWVTPLWERMQSYADVVVVDAAHAHRLVASNFRCVCTLRSRGDVVRMVFARPELDLPPRDKEVAVYNAAYDQSYTPHELPIPLATPRDYDEARRRYGEVLAELRTRHVLTAERP